MISTIACFSAHFPKSEEKEARFFSLQAKFIDLKDGVVGKHLGQLCNIWNDPCGNLTILCYFFCFVFCDAAFFILGGVCVSFGGASYVGSLFALRRMMLLSVPALLLQSAAVGSVALFWLCAVSLYIGRLEVEIIHEDEEGEDDDECQDCRERRESRRYGRHQDSEDSDGKGPNK